jgi:hypothetical protein
LTTQAAWPAVDIRGNLFRIGSVGTNQITDRETHPHADTG